MSFPAREIHLKSRPAGLPRLDNFELVERRLPAPAQDQIMVRTSWMSVDPYMRGRMIDRPSYIEPFPIGAALEGSAVGVVEVSESPRFKPGDLVSHFAGWRDRAVIDAAAAMPIDAVVAPAPAWLGPLGIPGFTAYVGLERIGALQQGETLFVSAAAGAVGSIAAQIGKLRGARVIGSAGSDDKVRWLSEELGLDAVINYRTAGDLAGALATAAPEGVDVYFDNVGGDHLEAAIAAAKPLARVVLCGMIAQYNEAAVPPGPNLFTAATKGMTLRGFIVTSHFDLMPAFMADMAKWLADGRIQWRETVVDGLDKAPEALIDLFAGRNLGKMLVRLEQGPSPAP